MDEASLTPQEWRLIDRFKEPSSYAALGGLFAMAGVTVPQGWMQIFTFAGCAVCTALGVLLKEGNTNAS
jgi:hypothetical protein